MLEIGQRVPSVFGVLPDGSKIDLSGPYPGPRVVYFYPKPFTPGCTREACSFRDAHEQFTDGLGAEVYAVSRGEPELHGRFKAEYQLPFHLVADVDGSVVKAFGVQLFGGVLPLISRATFVIDAGGTVRDVFVRQLSWDGHVKAALAALAELTPQERSVGAAAER